MQPLLRTSALSPMAIWRTQMQTIVFPLSILTLTVYSRPPPLSGQGQMKTRGVAPDILQSDGISIQFLNFLLPLCPHFPPSDLPRSSHTYLIYQQTPQPDFTQFLSPPLPTSFFSAITHFSYRVSFSHCSHLPIPPSMFHLPFLSDSFICSPFFASQPLSQFPPFPP